MNTITRPTQTEADIWTGILYPDGVLTAPAASAILRLAMKTEQRQRMRLLSAKAAAGTLTPDEEFEMQNFERVGDLLSILKSKARQVLKKSSS